MKAILRRIYFTECKTAMAVATLMDIWAASAARRLRELSENIGDANGQA